MKPQLDICLLGPPSILRNGEQIAGFVSRSAQALFYFLVTTGQRHDRSWLASLLWPETAETTARKNLRDILSNLRKLFGSELHITPDAAGFDASQPYTLDVKVFESLARRWRSQADPQTLQQMTTLYRGDFLEGFRAPGATEFESWLLSERERLRDQIMWAMDILVDLALQQNDFATGLAFSRRLLTMEPWRENTHRQRMRLLAASGQRGAALAQYEQCKSLLQSEFGVAPMAETRRVFEEIRASQAEEITSQTAKEAATPGARIQTPARHNLPRLYTPLFGREQEIAAIAQRLRDPACALVTLTGEGGVGKTRLALAAAGQIAGNFPDGVWFVPLAGVGSDERELAALREEMLADIIGGVLARAMQLSLQGPETVFTQVLNALKAKRTLLVLDNFEHLTDFSSIVLRILDACPRATVLVTSRHRLKLQAEWVFVVAGLPVPEELLPGAISDLDLLNRNYSSLQLFSERAQRSGATFHLQRQNLDAVLSICRLLEGLPLGIELAAGLIPELDPDQIAAELQRSHHILTGEMADMPARHRSIQALFDFSWRLLSEAERQMVAVCAVFTDRFSGAAATAISGLPHEHLQALVHKSLLRQLDEDRFVMQPVVRHWAYEKLSQDAQRLTAVKTAFQTYFIAFVAERASQLGNDVAVNAAVQAESTHILAAWQFAVEQQNVQLLGQGAIGISQLMKLNGMYNEGARLHTLAAQHIRPLCLATDPSDRALPVLGRLLVEAAHFHGRTGQFDLSNAETCEARAISQQIGDRTLEIDSLLNQTYNAWYTGKRDEGYQYNRETLRLARAAGNLTAEAYTLAGHGIFLQHTGHTDQAVALFEQAMSIAQNAGQVRLALLIANYLGDAYLAQSRLWLAYVHFSSLLSMRGRVGDMLGEGVTLTSLTETSLALGDLPGAINHGQAAVSIFRQVGARRHESIVLSRLAFAFHQLGDQETAYAYAQQSLQIAEIGQIVPAQADAFLVLGAILTGQGQAHSAQSAFEEAVRLAKQTNNAVIAVCAQIRWARVLLAMQQNEAAQRLVKCVLPRLPELAMAWMYDPIELYIQCYTVLKANGDPAARQILQAGYALLCQQSDKIEDDVARHRFLRNVPSHQKISRLGGRQKECGPPTSPSRLPSLHFIG